MAARKKAEVVRPEPEADFPETDGVDLTQDPEDPPKVEASVPAAPKPPIPEDRPVKGTRPVQWRLLSNIFLDGQTLTRAGTIVDLTDSEVDHLRKQGAIEAVL